jgi:hypothetical protein
MKVEKDEGVCGVKPIIDATSSEVEEKRVSSTNQTAIRLPRQHRHTACMAYTFTNQNAAFETQRKDLPYCSFLVWLPKSRECQ